MSISKDSFKSENKLYEAKIEKHKDMYFCKVENVQTKEEMRSYKCSIFNKTNIREIKRFVKKDFNIIIDY